MLNFLLKKLKVCCTAIFVLVALQAAASSQQEKYFITYSSPEISIRDFFKVIKKKTNLTVFYNNQLINDQVKIKVNFNQTPLKEVMLKVLNGRNLTWELKENFILLKKVSVSPDEKPLKRQDINLSGQVVDEQNLPIQGVSIKVKNSQNGTVSDLNGNFKVSLNDPAAVLVFSFLGFAPQEKTITGSNPIRVVLKEQGKGLDEIVVIGYGTAKRSDLTGSVGSVRLGKTQEQSYNSLDQILGGRTAGVTVNQNSGQPGAGVRVEIRGNNSISASSSPLYVIDGIPLAAPDLSDLGSTTAQGSSLNPLAAINPNDIENIEVLKDASATAIYGSRGANGVILITTKTGRLGKAKIELNYGNGSSRIAKKVEVLNAQQYAAYANEAAINRGVNYIPFTPEELNTMPDYDHQREILQTGKTNDVSLSVSGGDNDTKYYLSGQYLSQEGIVINSGLTRYSFKNNFERKLSSKLRINTYLLYSESALKGSVTNSYAGGIIANALRWAPTSPFFNPDGTYNRIPTYHYGKDRFASEQDDLTRQFNNPLALARDYMDQSTSTSFMGNASLTYNFTRDLVWNGKFGLNRDNYLQETYRPTTLPILNNNFKGQATAGNNYTTKLLYETTLTYNKIVADKHIFNAVGGISAEKYQQKNYGASSQNFIQDITGIYNMAGGTTPAEVKSAYFNYALLSFIGRLNYNFNYKYYLTASGRYDGSSRFGDNNKFGFFPSVAFAWRINKEDFLKNSDLLSDAKLRLSYGKTGNQSIPSYQSLPRLSTGTQVSAGVNDVWYYYNTVFGRTPQSGYAPTTLANDDIKWEQTAASNIGLDLGFFKNRITLTTEVYYKKTNDLLLQMVIPVTTGQRTAFANIGNLENKGVEFTINAEVIKKESFQWRSDFNVAYNTNKVLALDGKDSYRFFGQAGVTSPIRVQVGESIGKFWGYVKEGIYNQATLAAKPATFQPTARPGDVQYKDLNADGIFNDQDKTFIGNSLPKFTGGFSNTFNYNKFELNVLFQYSLGNDMLNLTRWNLMTTIGEYNSNTDVLNRWTPENLNTDVPRAGHFSAPEVNTGIVENASYLRCNSITLSYALPDKVLKKLKMANIRIYGNLQNAFTITKYSGYTPTGNSSGNSGMVRGIDDGLYPESRTFRLGINTTF